MKREHEQHIDENIDLDEQLWLAAVERLQGEKDPEVSDALRARIREAIAKERQPVRRKIIRWPAIAASVAAAALVVWLVVPGLFNQSRAPMGELTPRQDTPVIQTTDSRAILPATTPSVDPTMEDALEAEPFAMPPDAAPEMVEAPVETKASGKTTEAAISPIQMDAPADVASAEAEVDEEVLTREIDAEVGAEKNVLYLGGDKSYVLRRIPASELKALDGRDTRVYRDTPVGRYLIDRFITELENPLDKADARRFVDEAFDAGFAVLIVEEDSE